MCASLGMLEFVVFGSRKLVERDVTISIVVFVLEDLFSDFVGILLGSFFSDIVTRLSRRNMLFNVICHLKMKPRSM